MADAATRRYRRAHQAIAGRTAEDPVHPCFLGVPVLLLTTCGYRKTNKQDENPEYAPFRPFLRCRPPFSACFDAIRGFIPRGCDRIFFSALLSDMVL